jgi:hypothetical protein
MNRRAPVVAVAAVLLAGALVGVLWWGVSWTLGAQAYGVWGTHAATGLLAGIVTGIAMTAMSAPMYRRVSVRGLYWYSPLSVYVSISIYGLVILLLRHLVDDFDPRQARWAVGLQSILGMWWGITVLVPLALAVQVLAYATHRVLRRILTTT